MNVRTSLGIGCAVAILAGCSGRNASPLPNVAGTFLESAPAKPAKATLTILVSVPRSASRSPRYISAATKGMTLLLKGPEKHRKAFGLTRPSDRNCKNATGVTTCTFKLLLSVGDYKADIAMFDRPPTDGHIPTTANLLSIANNVPFTIKRGKVTRLKFKPEGVIASLAISGLPSGTVGVSFPSAQRFTVTGTDADGYIIVGRYKHVVFLADSDTTGATTIATSGSDNPPKGALLSSGDSATLDYTGSAIVPAAIIARAMDAQTGTGLFTLNEKALFIANNSTNTVTEYAPPYTGAPAVTISNGVSGPTGLAVDARGNLFVSTGSNSVVEYAPPYTGAPTATISSGLSQPFGPAFDQSGNLFVANAGSNSATEYAPPYTGAPAATISNSVNEPFGLTLDSSDNLFISNYGSATVTEYAPPYTGAPTVTVSSGLSQPFGVAVDSSGNLFVANGGNNTVTEYAPPYNGAAAGTISSGLSKPIALVFDTSDNLFVANEMGNNVTEYAPPYSGAPSVTISKSVNSPLGVALSP